MKKENKPDCMEVGQVEKQYIFDHELQVKS